MSKAAELAALIGSGQAQGNRNTIINGAMQVQQRGTVTGITGTAYGSCDRFKLQMTNAGTWTASQDASAPSGFTTSNKLDCTTADASLAAADFMFYAQHVEAQNLQNLKWGTSNAESLTLSFWVKSNKTGVYSTEIQHGDMGSGNYWNNNTYTISSANTWEYKTIPITGETSTAINNDNGIGLYVRWWLASGTDYSSGTQAANTWQGTAANRVKNNQVNLADNTSNDWLITGVQVEIGDVATPFEHEDIGTTLAKCQRYYQKSFAYGTAPVNDITGVRMSEMPPSNSASYGGAVVYLEKTMRANPSVVAYNPQAAPSNSGAYINDLVNSSVTTEYQIASVESLSSKLRFLLTTAPTTGGNPYGCNWTAEAEL
tara:strand:- start:805 stop:1920 length:1116 start_codon:yes stop_codon:yes gene_type:complete